MCHSNICRPKSSPAPCLHLLRLGMEEQHTWSVQTALWSSRKQHRAFASHLRYFTSCCFPTSPILWSEDAGHCSNLPYTWFRARCAYHDCATASNDQENHKPKRCGDDDKIPQLELASSNAVLQPPVRSCIKTLKSCRDMSMRFSTLCQ